MIKLCRSIPYKCGTLDLMYSVGSNRYFIAIVVTGKFEHSILNISIDDLEYEWNKTKLFMKNLDKVFDSIIKNTIRDVVLNGV